MDIIFFYIWAAFLTVIGGLFWILSKKIVLWEWLAGGALAFVMAGIFHLAASFGATSDIETWSGHIVKTVFYPEWVEEYQQMHTRQVPCGTDSNGNTRYTTEVYYTTEHTTHYEYWECYSNIDSSILIFKEVHENIAKIFGNLATEKPYKSGFDYGDPNIYVSYNKDKKEFFPITDKHHFSNKIRATPTTFSFPKVPQNIFVYSYPENSNPFQSDRLVGTASKYIDRLTFDRLNARLGPRKKVNLILVGFSNRDSMTAQWQEAAWLRGKKNDVVITFSHGQDGQLQWVKAFGWTDKKTCLRNLETIVLDNGVKNGTLDLIESEIVKNYTLKNWEESFAHIRVPAPNWAVWTYFIVSILAQTIFWIFAHVNQDGKGGRVWRYRY